ncbi:unnamed protein product [Vitrella brassicaformis CCMP3155]|uniref:Secreted protein n=1 Tax=Vitrella brassicaformis (strain CCMP3155) TaxID=1169540 RepID=A0A0G4GTR0_VITBC|nr:unnamed protein product [Vitrella brassicaformis CCMP3155]|eukprot:CEM34107.1 unnamed protein product [Vitrella brassicaformis CCMP3155]
MAVVVCPLVGLLIAVLVPRAAECYRMEPDQGEASATAVAPPTACRPTTSPSLPRLGLHAMSGIMTTRGTI